MSGRESKSPRRRRSKRPSDSVCVAVRLRPASKKEASGACAVAMKEKSCNVKALRSDGQVKSKTITIDHCFETDCGQCELYTTIGQGLVDNAWNGFNSSLLAYGQTGSGKTHSVFGPMDLEERSLFTPTGIHPQAGLVPRVFHDILTRVAQSETEHIIEVAMMEIYLERTFDLLRGRVQVDIRGSNELGFFAEKLTKRRVGTHSEVAHVLKDGNTHKTQASTALNSSSSRAHTILEIYVRKLLPDTTSAATSAKITIVDLAGSENVKQSEVRGELLQQASNINMSLMELGRVVEKVVEHDNNEDTAKGAPISFRGSALTKLLKESIGGNSKATILVTISPVQTDSLQTLNALRFADRAKHLRNHAQFNEGAFSENKTRLRIVNEEHRVVLEKHKLEQKHIELLNKQAKYEQDAANLRRQQRALSSKIAHHTAMTDAEKTAIKERREQLAAEEKRAKELQKAIKEEIERLVSLQAALKKKSIERETERIEKERLEAEISEYLGEVAHLNVALETSERQVKELKGAVQVVESQKFTAVEEARQQASRAAADEISSLGLELKNRELDNLRQCTRMQQTIDNQEQQITDLADTVARLERQLDVAASEKREAEASYSLSKIETTGLQMESRQLLVAFDEERHNMCRAIKQEKKYHGQLVADLKQEIDRMRVRHEAAADGYKEKLNSEMEARMEERKVLVTEQEEVRRDLRKVSLEVSSLREQNCRFQDEHKRTLKRVSQLDEEERKQWEAKHEWRSRCQALAASLRSAGRLQKELEDTLRRTHEEYASLASRIRRAEHVDAMELEALKPYADELARDMHRRLEEYAGRCRRHINGVANSQRVESESLTREVEVIKARSVERLTVLEEMGLKNGKEREGLLLDTDVMVSLCLNNASPRREEVRSANTSPVSVPSQTSCSLSMSGHCLRDGSVAPSPLAIPLLRTPTLPPSLDHLEHTYPVEVQSGRATPNEGDSPGVVVCPAPCLHMTQSPMSLPQPDPSPPSARSRWEQRSRRLAKESGVEL